MLTSKPFKDTFTKYPQYSFTFFTLPLLGWLWVVLSTLFSNQLSAGGGYAFCPFRAITGLPCGACGLSRSVVHFWHFNFEFAYRAHLLGMGVAVVMAMAPLLFIYNVVSHQSIFQKLDIFFSNRIRTILFWVILNVVIAVGWGVSLHRHLNNPNEIQLYKIEINHSK